MATYQEIKDYIKKVHGVNVQTCWIADMKEFHGLPKRIAPNRIDENKKVKPCPMEKRSLITEAFMHFKMI